MFGEKKTKKNFCSLKNGRIFAFAFRETPSVDKSKRTLNYFETRDSVCRSNPLRRIARHETSQRLKSNSYNEEFDPGSG